MNAQNRIQRQLEEVLRLPGNDKCADCKASAPRWASINLGIFLCVNCASVHRKMGTHRSRVKSVTLDEWTREQVSFMREVGNIRSNQIYNPDEGRHPHPATISVDERDSEMSKFIRRKYELGAFKSNASKDLASSNAITSRALARDARNGHQSSGQSDTSPRGDERRDRDRDRELPSLPAPSPTAGRRRATPNTAFWSGLAPQGTGTSSTSNASAGSASSGSRGAPTRSNSSPADWATTGASAAAALLRPKAQPAPPRPSPPPSAQKSQRPDLLIDIDGSSTSTRPLQLNGFPTVPFQPPNATPAAAPALSPVGVVSPLALGGQQSYFQANNPFLNAPQVMLQPQQTSYQNPFNNGMNGMNAMNGMNSMNGMNGMNNMNAMSGMGMNGMGSRNGYSNAIPTSPMASNSMSSMGVGMPGAMGAGMNLNGMGMPNGMIPVQAQSQWQQHRWGGFN